MTYPDPKRIRDNRLTLRLDDYEHGLVQALANYQGEQLSTLLRDLVMREAQQVLSHALSVNERTA
ncbi:hypothetical protein [Variovorax sp. OV700]|uniref:hypothetical protein n=1 Tax=Variovorax sp. OV700 TaxID=1882826 RepID=UPI0008854D4A|nr:hypothetical protein [Variovorax sp. OV700]SDI77690.1 hypothetical protein SAMN05444748_107104 [Variovorax sp. OV700]